MEPTTDRKLPQHITILIRAWSAGEIELKNAYRSFVFNIYGSLNFGFGT